MQRCAAAAAALLLLAASCSARRDGPTPATGVAPQVAPTPQSTTAPAASATPAAAVSRDGTPRTVAVIGDSIAYGTPPVGEGLESPYSPTATLATLLAALEPPPGEGGTPWRGARVLNLAVGASDTSIWLARPPRECHTLFNRYPVVQKACAANVAWVDAVWMMAGGRPIDAVIVDLGINDRLITDDPRETVDRLLRIRDALAPAPVLVYPPIAPRDGPRGDWPQRVRAAMEERGLFAETQYPPYLPTYDGLHPTHGGYAALGALWLDGLRRLP